MEYNKTRGTITSPSRHSNANVAPFDDSPPSYFITFKIPAKPKLRIKIPKLLSKSMQKRFHGYNDSDDSTINRDGDCRRPKRTKTRGQLVSGKIGSIFNNVMKTVGFALEEEESRTIGNDGNGIDGGRDKGACAAMNTVPKNVVVMRRRESRGKFIMVPRRVRQNEGTPRKVWSMRRFEGKKFDFKCLDLKHSPVAEREAGLELCKKRILMGGKCKPLSISGALHYDKNGILLPEELP